MESMEKGKKIGKKQPGSKISVIIPVYNVADYLNECLDSVCGQTYSNLEIIMVDDGSTDLSGKICDEYARCDSRVVVIHKENGGLADARNVGLAAACGDYIGFVDSDDWIEKDMYERLYNICEETGADLALARFCEERKTNISKEMFTDKMEILDSIDLLKISIMGDQQYLITDSVWDRLYKKSLLDGIFFLKGKCYEDILFTLKVFLKVQRAVYLDSKVYHYRVRDDSIMGMGLNNATSFSDNIITDWIPQMKEKICILYDIGLTEFGDETLFKYLLEILYGLEKTYHRKQYSDQYNFLKQEFMRHKAWIKSYIRKNVEIRRKIILGVGSLSIEMYIWLVNIKRKIGI